MSSVPLRVRLQEVSSVKTLHNDVESFRLNFLKNNKAFKELRVESINETYHYLFFRDIVQENEKLIVTQAIQEEFSQYKPVV